MRLTLAVLGEQWIPAAGTLWVNQPDADCWF